MKVKLYVKYYEGFPLFELDARRMDKIRPGKKGMEGFFSDDKEPSMSKAICFYVAFFRYIFCLEVTYKVVKNKFQIRKAIRELLKKG